MTFVSRYAPSPPRLRRQGAPVLLIMVALLASIAAILTMQMAGFIAYVDVTTNRAYSNGGRVYDGQGNSSTGWGALWQQYGALGWVVLALGLLIALAWMWRSIGSKHRPTGWFLAAGIGAVASLFWLINATRYPF